MSPSSSKPGKRFEEDFQKSALEHHYVFKLRDCGGWGSDSALRFTPSNPFDFFFFDRDTLFCLELKSTGSKSLRYDALRDNQRAGLHVARNHPGVVAGLVVNFRSVERTFFIEIQKLEYMESWSTKKSFNVEEAEKNGIRVPQRPTVGNRRPRYELSLFTQAARRFT